MCGIPEKIGRNVARYLEEVVKGEKPIVEPQDDLLPMPDHNILDANGVPIPQPAPANAANGEMFIEDTRMYHNRKYRDSMYAVLASMYTQLRPDMHHQLSTWQVEKGMQPFTDLQVGFDHRDRSQGAFKAHEGLVKYLLLNKNRVGMRMNR